MTNTELETFGNRIGRAIARERQRCRLTQGEVAERVGLGNEAVSRIERDIVVPSLDRLFQFAQVFECEAGDLLNETSPLAQDRVHHLVGLLEPLSSEDRDLVTRFVEQLSLRLQQTETDKR